jgi:hypothetical protein
MRLDMNEEHKTLLEELRTAFGHVAFPSHQGLRASMAVDWHTPQEELPGITERDDIKGEWWEIPSTELYAAELGMSYLDARGVEFYLPAYLRAAMDDVGRKRLWVLPLLDPTLRDDDAEMRAYFEERLSRIDRARAVVCLKVLRYLRSRLGDYIGGGEEFDIEQIDRILRHSFWQRCVNG